MLLCALMKGDKSHTRNRNKNRNHTWQRRLLYLSERLERNHSGTAHDALLSCPHAYQGHGDQRNDSSRGN